MVGGTVGRADVAWVVGAEFQGRGYAVEAASALVAWLRERGVGDIRAQIRPGHAASAKVAERIGLVPTGELDDEGEQVWRAQGAPEHGVDAVDVNEDFERTEKTR